MSRRSALVAAMAAIGLAASGVLALQRCGGGPAALSGRGSERGAASVEARPDALRAVAPSAGPRTLELAPGASDGSSLAFWRVSGLVATRDGIPVEGAAVEIEVTDEDEVRTIARGVSDADGAYTMDAPLLGRLEASVGRGARISAWAGLAGYTPGQSDLRYLPAEDQPPAVMRLDVTIEPLRGLFGRVVDVTGQPVPEAMVGLRGDGAAASSVEAEVDEFGYYSFDLVGAPETSSYWISGDEPSVGSGIVGPVECRTGVDVRAPDIVLLVLGTIDGVARLRNGTPASGVIVYACEESAAATSPFQGSAARKLLMKTGRVSDGGVGGGIVTALEPDDAALETARPDGIPGLVRSAVETGPNGAFRLVGLRPGRYRLSASLREFRDQSLSMSFVPSRAYYGSFGDPEVVAETGQSGVLISIEWSRLIVSVRDEEGSPVPGAFVSTRSATPETTLRGSWWAGEADATQEYQAAPGEAYVVSARKDERVAEATVTVAEDGSDTIATLTIRPLVSGGFIRLSVLDDEGQPFRPYEATLTNLASWSFAYQGSGDSEGRIGPVPPGRYLLSVGRPSIYRGDPILPIRTEVEVLGDQEVPVTLEARSGARVRVILKTAEPCHVALGVIEAVSTGGDRSVPLRLYDWEDKELQAPVMNVIRSGVAVPAFKLLVPGDYILHVEVNGFRSVDVPFVAPAGGTADVEVPLEPE